MYGYEIRLSDLPTRKNDNRPDERGNMFVIISSLGLKGSKYSSESQLVKPLFFYFEDLLIFILF